MAIIKQKQVYDPSKGNPVGELTKQLKELLAVQKEITEQNSKLSQSLNLVKKSSDGTEAKKLVTVTNQLKKSNQELTETQKQRIAVKTQLDKAIAKSKILEDQNLKTLNKTKIAIQEKQKLDKLQIQINKAQAGSIEKLRLETRKLTQERDKLGAITGKNAKQFKQLTTQINNNNTRLKAHGKAINDNTRNVGNYGSALKGLGSKLLGAAGIVGGIDLLIRGFTALIERTNELSEATKKIENTFDVSNKQAKKLSGTIIALANNFKEDYNEILLSANAVSKEFGITGENALALIEEGFKKGSNNSGEFLDILKEYPVQLKSVGLSAEESFAIINQQVRAGVYSDKGIDAIKEAGISLRENTKAVQDALSPLAENTRLEIEREVAAGNTFKAMQLVSKAMDETNLTAAQTQAIMSDVFKGAGEDSLSFIQNLHNVELGLEGVAEQTTYVENANLKLSKTWNKFVGNFTDSENIFSKVWGTFISLLSHSIEVLTAFLTDIGFFGEESAKSLGKISESAKTSKGAIDELKESTVELTSAQKKQLELQRELDKERERRAGISTIDQITTVQGVEGVTGGFDPIESAVKTAEEVNENVAAVNAQFRLDELEKLQEQEQLKKDIKDTFVQEASSFASSIFSQEQDEKLSKELDRIEAEKDALKDQLDKGLVNKIQYEAKLSELNKKSRRAEAQAEKKKALFDIGIGTAVAAIKALPNFLLSASIVAIGAIRAAFVAARPLPGLKDGIIGIDGPGTSKSDSIPAMLSKNESVITAEGTSNAPELLNAINKGLIRDKDIVFSKGKKDNLLAGLLMQGINVNKDMLTALKNLGYAIPTGNYVIEKRANGEIINHVIN